MADKFMARNYPITKAPRRIELLGDRTRRPEPAQHIIEFPGGAIELSRTSDGEYWAHIIINRREAFAHGSTRERAKGQVVSSRIGRYGVGIESLEDLREIEQIAVLVRSRPEACDG